MSQARTTKVLMIYPRFNADSFWNYTAACELFDARYPAAPLGLITVAAMLPPDWEIRLVNRNTEPLEDTDLAWPDLVMTGGMNIQQADTLRLIDLCHQHGKPVAVGGPDPTSSPHIYAAADFRVLGEAEGIIDKFIEAWQAGERAGVFEAEKFKADVTTTPIPRFDLLKFDQYLHIGVQFSRGCPFTCEFCDIIELYGRVPRTKTAPQMLAELDALYQLGYRGHVDFVDDNLIGNKKAIKAFLPFLQAWLDQREHPFEFSTEASLNLADDDEMLALMKRANFFAVFIGIESPDPDTLRATRKKQNTRRNIAESVHKIYAAGMFVTAGFIIGFDEDKDGIADAMIELFDETAVPACMVGLLTALPNTQLTRRLEKEGRLHAHHDRYPDIAGDHMIHGLNFESRRSRARILQDYRRVLAHAFDPVNYCRRVERVISMLDRSDRKYRLQEGDVRFRVSGSAAVHGILSRLPEHRELLWQTFKTCMARNPNALRDVVTLLAFYLHLGPYARRALEGIDLQIANLETGALRPIEQMRAEIAALSA